MFRLTLIEPYLMIDAALYYEERKMERGRDHFCCYQYQFSARPWQLHSIGRPVLLIWLHVYYLCVCVRVFNML